MLLINGFNILVFNECCRYRKSPVLEATCSTLASGREFNEPVILKEIRNGIKSLKNNTSVGYDCISNEMLKHSS